MGFMSSNFLNIHVCQHHIGICFPSEKGRDIMRVKSSVQVCQIGLQLSSFNLYTYDQQ